MRPTATIRRTRIGATWLLGTALLLPIAPVFADAPAVLVQAEGVTLTAGDLRTELAAMPEAVRARAMAEPGVLNELINTIYRRKAVAAAARAQKLDADPEIAAQLARVQEDTLAKLMLERQRAILRAQMPDMTARAEESYRTHPERFRTPERINARHILLRATTEEQRQARTAEAAAILDQLRAGADFATLAGELSEDPGSAQRGGDLGQFGRGAMVKEFEDAAFALHEPGALSEVIASPFGLHIIQLTAREPERQRSFEEVRAQLIANLRATWLNEAVETWRQQTVDPARATVHNAAIDALIEAIVKQAPPPRAEPASPEALLGVDD